MTGTLTYARNNLESVYENSATYDNPNRRISGRPIGTQFGLHALGYFTPDDFNSDGTTLRAGIPRPTFGPVRAGDIRAEIACVVSNHRDLEPVARSVVPPDLASTITWSSSALCIWLATARFQTSS